MTPIELKYLLAKACIGIMKNKHADDETKLIAIETALKLSKTHQKQPESGKPSIKHYH